MRKTTRASAARGSCEANCLGLAASTDHSHRPIWFKANRPRCRPVLVDVENESGEKGKRSLAWQVHGTETLTPHEALDIYERTARHLDAQSMSADEQALWDALRLALGRSRVRFSLG